MTQSIRCGFSERHSRVKWLAAITVVVLVLVSVACGSSEPAAQPTVEPTPTAAPAPAPTVASTPTAAPVTAAPPAVAVIPIEVPAAGSTEEKVLAALEKQVRSINVQDWNGYLEVCSPARNITTVSRLKFAFEEIGGEFGFDIPSFSMEGYNARNVRFTIYGEDNARTTFDIFDHDSFVATGVSRTWERVDGDWYSDALTCGFGG